MEDSAFLKIINIDSIDSTNDYAFRLAESGEREITVIKANLQSGGRGRFKRKWISPKDRGIYASFILRPQNPLKELTFLPLIFSYAVFKVLNNIIPLMIKWPNDLIVGSKKIAGILIEAKSTAAKADFVIAGLGINVNSLKDEIPDSATSLRLQTENIFDINELFDVLLAEVMRLYKMFKKDKIDEIITEITTACRDILIINGDKIKVVPIRNIFSEKNSFYLYEGGLDSPLILR